MSDKPTNNDIHRRAVQLVAPLIIVALVLGVLAVLVNNSRLAAQTETVGEPAPPTATPMAETILPIRPTIALATPWGVLAENETPTVGKSTTPVFPVVTPAPVTVLGPPADSRFSVDSRVTFYWTWPATLEEGQQFVLRLRQDAEWQELAQIDEPNLGDAFQLTVRPSEIDLGPGEYLWQVVLVEQDNKMLLAESVPRLLTLREE